MQYQKTKVVYLRWQKGQWKCGIPRRVKCLGQAVTGRKVGCMFEVYDLKIPSQVVSATATTATPLLDLWHARLGHPSLSRLQLLASQGHLGLVQFQEFNCTSYHFDKQTKLPFDNSDSFSSAPFDLIHSDIWGPTPVPTRGDLDILLYLWMIFLVILGFICFTIGLNLCLFTKHFIKWLKHSSIAPSKSFDQIMLKNIMINLSYPF